MAITPQQIDAFLIALIQAFFSNNPTAVEIEGFLIALAPSLGQPSGNIPAFKAGNTWYGPIPFGPTQPG